MMARDPVRDVVRGLTVLEMETINLSRTMLFHAPIQENRIAYADTIFPTFAFVAGMTPTPWRRSVSLMGLGLAYNSISVIAHGKDYQPRYLGVLQRTGLSSLIFNGLAPLVPMFPVIMSGLWLLVSTSLAEDSAHPFAEPQKSAQTCIDTSVFSPYSLYRKEYDPEGLLGSLTTATNMWAGRWYLNALSDGSMDFQRSCVLGTACILGGYTLSSVFPRHLPVNKPYWTPSFALVTAGITIIKYAAVAALLPYMPEMVRYPLECIGRRSIEVYFSSALMHNVLRGSGISNWARNKLTQLIGARAADVVCVSISNIFMTLLAVAYVKFNLRLRW